MQYIPGTLGLTSSIEENAIGELLDQNLGDLNGVIGYRIPSVGVGDPTSVPSFIIQAEDSCIILIDIISSSVLRKTENEEYWFLEDGTIIYSRDIILDNFELEIENRLKEDIHLYNRRTKKFNISIVKILVFCNNSDEEIQNLELINIILRKEQLSSEIQSLIEEHNVTNDIWSKTQSLLEGTKVFEKDKAKVTLETLDSIGDYINRSLATTFKLDEDQRKISMQLPQGPQRIRGLAGTGKTVILALKAALTHKDAEDFKILSVFNTQSMYNQITGLISKYYTYETRKEPNWKNLQVQHAWGGKSKPGFYSSICERYGIAPFRFGQVRDKVDPYHYIFSDLLSKLRAMNVEPIYDMVLIDEAQDFVQPFFELVFLLTKPPKRIVWAYDEFQSLNDLRIKEPEELFGRDGEGKPNIQNDDLSGKYLGGIDKDFILSNSYRNPRMGLMTAHGLGLGIYSKGGIVDILPDTQSWEAIGYEVIEPENKASFEEGDSIKVRRSLNNSKNILENLLIETGKPEMQLVKVASLPNSEREYASVAKEIHRLINKENIAPEQIIVISLSTAYTNNIYSTIRQMLDFHSVKSIMPGYIEDPDMFQEKGFVTLATPYRAKGNEANVVFVTDAQNVISNKSFRSRNAIFVSVTRSRGLTYITGSGSNMRLLEEEFKSIKADYPNFNFVFPSEEELKRRRVILSKNDSEIERTQQQIDKIIDTNEDLLIEIIKTHPELLSKLTPKRKKKDS